MKLWLDADAASHDVKGLCFRASSHSRGRLVLAVFLLGAGVLHFVNPHPFERIVPLWIPDAPLAVALSGVAEILGGAGLLIPSVRRAGR